MNQIHIAYLSHERVWIDDQVQFLEDVFSNLGFTVTASPEINKGSFNFIFEGLTPRSIHENIDYFRDYPERYAVVLTEHLEVSGDRTPYFNGLNGFSDGDLNHDPNFSPRYRLNNLIHLTQFAKILVCCGDSPDLNGYRLAFPRHLIGSLPWPRLKISSSNEKPKSRLLFSAAHPDTFTKYRKLFIHQLRLRGIEVDCVFGLNLEEWKRKIEGYAAVLDVPKSENWRWDSPMRTFRAVKNGKLVLTSRKTPQHPQGIHNHFEFPLNSSDLSRLDRLTTGGDIQTVYDFFQSRQDFAFIETLSDYINSLMI